jgi:hypothetical protein
MTPEQFSELLVVLKSIDSSIGFLVFIGVCMLLFMLIRLAHAPTCAR